MNTRKARRCQSHCSGCGSHFASDSAFDAHRGGSFQENTRCCWPEGSDERTLILREDGICDIGGGATRIGVSLYGMNPDFRSGSRVPAPSDAPDGSTVDLAA